MTSQDWVQLVLGAAGAIGTVAWGIVRYFNSRMDEERAAREKDRYDMHNKIQTVKNDLQAHELHVAQQHPNLVRLAEALKPVETAIARVENTLERLFDELKGKQDKER